MGPGNIIEKLADKIKFILKIDKKDNSQNQKIIQKNIHGGATAKITGKK